MNNITRYKEEHINFLRENTWKEWPDTVDEFNKTFKTNKTRAALAQLAKKNGIRKHIKIYTEKHALWLKENSNGMSYKELLIKFNDHFNMNRGYSSFRAFAYKEKINIDPQNRFKPGHEPWNKGIKGLDLGGNAGWFKKGQAPVNHRVVGSERINSQGYTYIKVAEPNKWKGKHVLLWEKHYGAIPKGYNIVFADRNKQNFEIDNLILVNKRQLIRLNANGYITENKELTKAGLNLVKLDIAIIDRGKKNEKKNLRNV